MPEHTPRHVPEHTPRQEPTGAARQEPEHTSRQEPEHTSRQEPTGRVAARPTAVLRAELDDLRRYLAETPPHHGAGDRTALQARVAALERALADGVE